MEIIQFTNPAIQKDKIYIHPDEAPNLTDRKKRYYAWLAECQKYYQRNPVKFIEDAFEINLIDAQKLVVQMAWTTPNVLLNCTRGFGKALDLKTKILTPKGFKLLKDIHPGDQVFSQNGKPTRVIAESEVWHNQTYGLIFDDDKIIANEDHLWNIWIDDHYELLDTKTLAEDSRPGKYIDYPDPIDFPERKVSVDPYVLGLWLFSKGEENLIEVMRKDADEIINKLEERNYIVMVRPSPAKRRVYLSLYNSDGSSFATSLEKLGVYKNKRIPEEYLVNSAKVRLSFLEGMIDGINQPSLKDDSLEYSIPVTEFSLKRFERIIRLFTLSGMKFKAEQGEDNSILFRFWPDPARVKPIQRIASSLPSQIDPENKRKKIIAVYRESNSKPTKCIQVADPSGLFLCGNSCTVTHNSTIISMILMAKGMLFNNYWTYIASGTANQAQTTFNTLERIAKDNIDSFRGSTGYIFKNELIKNATTGQGFTHGTKGWKYTLGNGSETRTLSSNTDGERGQRGNIVFDESAWLSDEMINTLSAFAVVDKDFATSTDKQEKSTLQMMTEPKEIPYQRFFISSASTTDSEFYRLYREFTKKMLMGDTDYFVAEFDYTITQHPLMNGSPAPRSLLSKSQVDSMMQTNPEKAMREYFCQFTTDVGDNAIVRRSTVLRNTEIRPPLLENDTEDKKFIIAYDPARIKDNSVVGVGEIYQDEDGEYKLRIVNCVNLVDIATKKNSPGSIQFQIETLRKIILDYNRGGDSSYSNIEGIYIDRGNGGNAPAIYDLLTENWEDEDGKHFGFIDPEMDPTIYNDEAVQDKIHMMEPTKYKPIMYDYLIDLLKNDAIKFTDNYDNKDYLITYDEEEDSDPIRIPLDLDQQAALINIDCMKDQLVNMVRIKSESSRGDRFEIAREKRRAYPHDDHAYVCALLAYGLQQYRNKHKKKEDRSRGMDLVNLLSSRMQKPRGLN